MNYKRAILISNDNRHVSLRISVGDNGDVFVKVKNGNEDSEIVHLKNDGGTNKQIMESLKEIADVYEFDKPIGTVVIVDGIEFVCTKAHHGCIGCAFDRRMKKCPNVYCCGDDRADGFDVYFKEK